MDGRTDGWMDGRTDGWMARWVGGWMGGGQMSQKELRNSARIEVLTAGLLKHLIVWDYKQLLWLLHLVNNGTILTYSMVQSPS